MQGWGGLEMLRPVGVSSFFTFLDLTVHYTTDAVPRTVLDAITVTFSRLVVVLLARGCTNGTLHSVLSSLYAVIFVTLLQPLRPLVGSGAL